MGCHWVASGGVGNGDGIQQIFLKSSFLNHTAPGLRNIKPDP